MNEEKKGFMGFGETTLTEHESFPEIANKHELKEKEGKDKKRDKANYAFIGKALKAVREEREINQTQLAKLAGLTQAQLSCYENGTNLPSPEILERLFSALNVRPLTFAFKCFEEAKIMDSRNILTVEEYEPIIQDTLGKIHEARRRIHN